MYNEQILAKREQNRQANIALTNSWKTRSLRRVPLGTVDNPAVASEGGEVLANAAQPIDDGGIVGAKPEIEISQDDWRGRIESWLTSESPEGGVSTAGILLNCLCVVGSSVAEQMRVADIMKSLGYSKARTTVRGKRDYYWHPVVAD